VVPGAYWALTFFTAASAAAVLTPGAFFTNTWATKCGAAKLAL